MNFILLWARLLMKCYILFFHRTSQNVLCLHTKGGKQTQKGLNWSFICQEGMEITLKKRMRIRFSIFLDIGIELKKRTCVRMINLQEPKCRWKHIVCKIKKMDLSQKRSWTLLIDNITNYHLNILYIRFFMAQNVLFEVTITYNYFLISFSVENIAYRRIWHAETLPAFFTIVTNSLSVVTNIRHVFFLEVTRCTTSKICSLNRVPSYPLRCIMTWLTSFSWASYSRLSNFGSLVALVMWGNCLARTKFPLHSSYIHIFIPNSLLWG